MKKTPGRRDMRKFDRRQAELPVTLSAPNGEQAGGRIQLDSADLSEGGAFLRSELLFEVGETLQVEIPLPSGHVVKASGRVARVEQTSTGQPGMGIQFIDLSMQDRRALSASLAKLGAGTMLPETR